MDTLYRLFSIVSVAIFLLVSALPDRAFSEPTTSYNRQIQPLLSDRCFLCHGPDASSREADLRLDTSEFSYLVIEPGDVWASELADRIMSDDPDYKMPPPSSGKTLSEVEIAVIKQWITEGAEYEPHWAFVTPKKSSLPKIDHPKWPVGAIDSFVLAEIEEQGLSPSPEADPITLLRRVTLDLTGLPPTRDETRNFLADNSPGAYEQCVDRLLASPRYGEHMARYWLDAARFGDTHGLHLDNYREIWPYRDAVIRAMNRNMPWDKFVVKNLAGDLLPDASLEDQVLSGFNRCHVTTGEGGSIKEEVYTRNVVDRVSTTGTVFLGLTMGCAVCHDHKYDPITSKDFYSTFAFFNNLDAEPMDGNAAKYAPVVTLPSPEQIVQQKMYEKSIAKLLRQLDEPQPEMDKAQIVWEAEWPNRREEKWTVVEPKEVKSNGGATLTNLEDGSVLVSGSNPKKDVHELVIDTNKTGIVAIRLESLVDESLGGSLGRSANGNAVLSELTVDIRPLDSKKDKPRTLHFVSVAADHSQADFPISNAIDGELGDQNGWAVEGHVHKESRSAIFVAEKPFGFENGTELHVRLAYETQHSQHALGRVRLAVTSDTSVQPIVQGPWSTLGPFPYEDRKSTHDTDFGPEGQFDLKKTYLEGRIAWAALPTLVDGQVYSVPREAGTTYLHRIINSPDSREITISLGSEDAIKFWLNGELVFENSDERGVAADQYRVTLQLKVGDNDLLVKTTNYSNSAGFYYKNVTETTLANEMVMSRLIATAGDKRSKEDGKTIRDFFRSMHSPEWQQLDKKLRGERLSKAAFDKTIPVSLVMRERAEPKEAFLLKRGEYDQPDKELGPLSRAVPAFLPPLPKEAPKNRLGYAQWLIDPAHPLMARVTVNRFWQQCFGTGFVKTSGDFGAQGAWPSHPELLDWLAVDFRESGWNVKQLMKRIVMSRTYQQSSITNDKLTSLDPDNRLLSRGPRFRLDAEVLRDQALAISGLMVDKIGGPSVKPPQPSGIWKAVAYSSSNTNKFVADTGSEKVHRRSLYTFWKRTAPPPEMSTLDAPSRESCVVRRERTNTPLQALLLLNDPQYIEPARVLAERAIVEMIQEPTSEIAATLFEMATLRRPNNEELAVLVSVYEASRYRYQNDLDAANKLIKVGETPCNLRIDPAELAAWTLVANAILNLDEILTKE